MSSGGRWGGSIKFRQGWGVKIHKISSGTGWGASINFRQGADGGPPPPEEIIWIRNPDLVSFLCFFIFFFIC